MSRYVVGWLLGLIIAIGFLLALHAHGWSVFLLIVGMSQAGGLIGQRLPGSSGGESP